MAMTCYTASNYSHVLAGRAYNMYGYAYAYGSNQCLGFISPYYMTTLKQTGAKHYVIDAGQ